ncbi:MAG TPA: hypothetical protein VJV04_09475 [Nitrospiraceae bacterium]|nr:hypothetical protein [Nitrospiraceae bacterium]
MNQSGRHCPQSYRYAARDLARPVELNTDTVYVVGGLYGNLEALQAVLAMAQREEGSVEVVFNGDFNWFNVDPASFEDVNRVVLRHVALRGNVETELAAEEPDAGCGYGYPDRVEEAEVRRSNAIFARLKSTAHRFPELRRRLGALRMSLVVEIGDIKVGVVHGDSEALNGWGFSHERLDDPTHWPWVRRSFDDAKVQIFASSHTCLPVLREYAFPEGQRVVINNGAAGMPNFSGMQCGLVSRISIRPVRHDVLYGVSMQGVYVQALPLLYDVSAWRRQFLMNWEPGTPAYDSYMDRIEHGPTFTVQQARDGPAR